MAIAGVSVSFNFQFQSRDVPYAKLTSRFDSGPWWGIQVTSGRRRQMDGFAVDLREHASLTDKLLVFYEGSGYNLYWGGPDPRTGGSSQATISYLRRHRIVPTVAVRLLSTAGMTDEELTAATGGLDYPPTLVRPLYVVSLEPADESTRDVLARLRAD